MKLYSHNGKFPSHLPHRIFLSNGKTRTGSESFTKEEIADAGFTEVLDPPTYEYPNKIQWDSNKKEWFVREPSDNELRNQWDFIRKECTRRLEETDYKIIKAMETGLPVDPSYVTYRQELRDLYNNVNDIDPWNVVFPNLINAYANTSSDKDGL